MPFPFERLEAIPENPSDVFHRYSQAQRLMFFSWIKEGLHKPCYDLSTASENYLGVARDIGKWVMHPSPARGTKFPREKRTIGNIKFQNSDGEWQAVDVPAIRSIQMIIHKVTTEANDLLETLISITSRLYGTENPWDGWPSLLRAAARGWAIA